MSTLITPAIIEPKNSAIPTRKMYGIDRDGNFSNELDFFKDAINPTWWNFYGENSTPIFIHDDIVYQIAVKSRHDCTGTDAELNGYKQEYKQIAVEKILKYYNKKYTSQQAAQISEFHTSVVDYHLEAKPSSKLKFLVEVEAGFINGLENNPPPSSFSNNLNDKGGLIIKDSFLNPTEEDPITGELINDKGISIVDLDSENFQTLMEKTSFFFMNWNKEMKMSGMTPKGVDLQKEAEYLQEASFLISDFASANFTTNGYSTGKNLTPEETLKFNSKNRHFIRLAFQEDPDTGEYYIPWASVKFENDDRDYILDVGFEEFINSHPIDSQTTLRYVFSYQRILKNFDIGVELNFSEFLSRYHYPPVSFADTIANKSKEAPFSTPFSNQPRFKLLSDPDRNYQKRKKTCGFKPWPPDFNFNPNWAAILGEHLQPINFTLDFGFHLFSLGPPCPAPPTSIMTTKYVTYWSARWNEFVGDISKDWKNLKKVISDSADDVVDTTDYYMSERWSDDVNRQLAKSAANFDLTLQKMYDIVDSKFSSERILQAVCICLTQLADDYMIENLPGYEDASFTSSLSLQAPNIGAGFNPQALVVDLLDDENDASFAQKLKDASATYGFKAEDWENFVQDNSEPLRLQKLCSFCIYLPDFFLRLPTFDMLRALLELLIAAIEALLTYLLIQLLLAAIEWLFSLCPKYKCSIRPAGAAVNDFGALSLPNFFPDNFDPTGPNNIMQACPALNMPVGAITSQRYDELQTLLFQRISEELSSGQLVNMLEGAATEATYQTIREIILEEEEFSDLAVYFSKGSRRKVEALVDCIFENADEQKVANVVDVIADPSYCPSFDQTPAGILSEKCNNEEQIKKFLTKEKFGKFASMKSMIDSLRTNPSFFGDMMPEVFNTEDEDTGETKQGLFSDPKFKPAVATTMVENLNPFIDRINAVAIDEGPVLLNRLQFDGPPNFFIPNDDILRDTSTIALAGSLSVAALSIGVLYPVALAIAPYSSPIADARRMDTRYPIIGGPNLQPSLQNAKQGITFSTNQINGNSFGLGSERKFDIEYRYKGYEGPEDPYSDNVGNFTDESIIKVNFESVTPKLLEDEQPLSNHIAVRVKSNELFYDSGYRQFSFRAPLSYDNNNDLEIKESLDAIGISSILDLTDANNDYSPQGKVFAGLIEKEMGNVFTNLDDDAKNLLHEKLSSDIHARSFKNMLQLFAMAAKDSPYFKTYTYEDIRNSVGSDGTNACGKPFKTKNFGRFGRKNPYSKKPGPAPFYQMFSANDKRSRTDVYWKPTAAIMDTPLRNGILEDGSEIEYINRTQFKENIINNWDWAKKENLGDPNSLTSLNYAILDEVIPQLVRFYSFDVCVKSMPVNKIFDDYGVSVVRDEIFSTVILQTILPELAIIPSFYTQAVLYWDRRFKKGNQPDFLTEKPTTGVDAIKALIQDSLGSKDEVLDSNNQVVEPKITGAMELSENVLNIKHIKDEEEKVDVAFDLLFEKGPSRVHGIFPVPNFDGSKNSAGVLKRTNVNNDTYRFNDNLKEGKFVWEGYIKFFLHQETIDYFKNNIVNGDVLVERLHGVPLPTDDLPDLYEEIKKTGTGLTTSEILSEDNIFSTHPLTAYLSYLMSLIGSGASNSIDKAGLNFGAGDKLENWVYGHSFIGAPDVSLFSDIKYGVRMCYVTTATAAEDGAFKNVIAGFYSDNKNQDSLKEIQKNKTFVYTEPSPSGETSRTVLSLPILTREFEGSERFGLTFGLEVDGTWENHENYGNNASKVAAVAQQDFKSLGMLPEFEIHKHLTYAILFFASFCKVPFSVIDKNYIPSDEDKANAKKTALKAYQDELTGLIGQTGTEAVDAYNTAFSDYIDAITQINLGTSDYLPNSLEAKGFGFWWFQNKFKQKSLFNLFKNKSEWIALIDYALPQSMAAGMTALYAYLNVLTGLKNKGPTFLNAKTLLKTLFIFAMSRSDFSGKPTNQDDIDGMDFSGMVPEDVEIPNEDEMEEPPPDEC